MLWESTLYRVAETIGQVHIYALETVHRTERPELLGLAAALRTEDADAAWPFVEAAIGQVEDCSYTQIVHDNEEVYPLAEQKYGGPGAVMVDARSELGGPACKRPASWTQPLNGARPSF